MEAGFVVVVLVVASSGIFQSSGRRRRSDFSSSDPQLKRQRQTMRVCILLPLTISPELFSASGDVQA